MLAHCVLCGGGCFVLCGRGAPSFCRGVGVPPRCGASGGIVGSAGAVPVSVPCRLLGGRIVVLCVCRLVVSLCLADCVSFRRPARCGIVCSPVVACLGIVAGFCGVLGAFVLCFAGWVSFFVFVGVSRPVWQIVFLCVCRRVVALVSRHASFFVFCVASCRSVSRLVVW